MDKKVTEKIAERIVDLEVDVILQEDLVDVLSTMEVKGEEAATLAQRLAMAKNQLHFNKQYVSILKEKYQPVKKD